MLSLSINIHSLILGSEFMVRACSSRRQNSKDPDYVCVHMRPKYVRPFATTACDTRMITRVPSEGKVTKEGARAGETRRDSRPDTILITTRRPQPPRSTGTQPPSSPICPAPPRPPPLPPLRSASGQQMPVSGSHAHHDAHCRTFLVWHGSTENRLFC